MGVETEMIANLKWIQENCDETSQVNHWTHYYFHGTDGRRAYVSVNDREKRMSAELTHIGDEVDIDMDAILSVEDFKHMLRMIGRKDDQD